MRAGLPEQMVKAVAEAQDAFRQTYGDEAFKDATTKPREQRRREKKGNDDDDE